MKFSPQLFIGIGATHAMFTLRETYLHESYSGSNEVRNGVFMGQVHREVRSFHHWNLATTPDEAFAKAKEDANQLGLPLVSTREGIDKELREIKRSTAEQLAERARVAAELKAKWDAEDAAKRAQWALEDAAMLEAGRYPFGRLKGEEFGVDIGYMNWVINKRHEFEEGSTMAKMAARMIELYPEAVLPKSQNKHWGEIGKRATVSGTVTSCRFYSNEMTGSQFHITNFVTDDGALLVAFGAFEADAGDKITIKATPKKHDQYKGEAQTIVNRIVQIGPMQDWVGLPHRSDGVATAPFKAPSHKAAKKAIDAGGRWSAYREVVTLDEYKAMERQRKNREIDAAATAAKFAALTAQLDKELAI